MLRGLKITMIVFGAVLVIEGILDIAFPTQRAAGMGLGECAAQATLPMFVLGASWVAAGAWTVAAGLDPLRNLSWVKFALTLPSALLVVLLLAAALGKVPLAKIAVDLVFDALFITLTLVFYPRAHRSREQVSAS
jgi:hypothetical protein